MPSVSPHNLRIFTFLLIGFCIPIPGISQEYEKIDATVSFYPKNYETAEALAKKIKKDFTNPKQQLRAAYSWLIHNVTYDPEEYYTYQFQYRVLEERNKKMAETREAIIDRTLQLGIAVCEGYALTLERLCELLGIQAYVVRGDTKTKPADIGRYFVKNHMWMVAIIDKMPILLDPTWGAGRFQEVFIKSPSYYYFDTPAPLFLKNHYPEVFEDAYVNFKLSREAFSLRPLVIRNRLTVAQVSPKEGILKAKELAKGIVFSLQGITAEHVSYTLDNSEKIKADFTIENDTLACTITTKTKAQSLIIYADDTPIIGYKITR